VITVHSSLHTLITVSLRALCRYFGDKDLHNPVVVSPDAGGVYRAKKFREGLAAKYDMDAGLAMIIKQRAKANEVDRMDLVGSVQDSDVIIVDDMIDTAGESSILYLAFLALYKHLA
jgi:phosphoribosylpyrophosphate synthetase